MIRRMSNLGKYSAVSKNHFVTVSVAHFHLKLIISNATSVSIKNSPWHDC